MRMNALQAQEMKRITVVGFVTDTLGNLLLVKPTYKDGWLHPGGMVERGESPREAWRRVIEDEIGLELCPEELLCIDYRKGDQESIVMVFSARNVTDEDIAKINIPSSEFSEYRMVPVEEARTMLRDKAMRRLTPTFDALRTHSTVYLEEGIPRLGA
jgi:ADP-ribose pyrophosphatase YjhB (NUDIX family)